MKTLLFILLFNIICLAQVSPNLSNDDFVSSTLVPGTVMLYKQAENGGMIYLCTAAAYATTKTGYDFVSAAHCVAVSDEDDNAVASKMFFVTSDNNTNKQFLRATVKYLGNRDEGDDFAVLQVVTKVDFPLIPLGVDAVKAGEPIVNIAAPMGLGIQVFQGFVSLPTMHRPVKLDDGTVWNDATLLQIAGTNGGSSGSPVICMHQRAICGFIIGIIGGTNSVAIPVSKFSNFIAESQSGKYDRKVSDK